MSYILKENETMDDVLKRLVDSFEWVHNVAPVAYWYEDLYENGRLKEIHYSGQMRKMLGYKSAEEFPDKLETLMAHIHPDDVQLMLDNAIAAGTGKTEKYNVEYRIRRADGEYIWVNATGQVIKNSDGATVGMYGAFIDISEEIALKEEMENKQHTDRIISAFTKEYEVAVLVDLTDGQYQVIQGKPEMDALLSRSGEFLPALKRYVEIMVHPMDRERFFSMQLSLENMREMIPVGQNSSMEFRSNTSGRIEWYRGIFSRISDNTVLFGFRNCDEEHTLRLVNDVLIDEYDAIYIVSLLRNRIRSVRQSRVSSAGVFDDERDYTDTILKFAETVAPEYRQDWKNFSDPEFMKAYMSNEDRREYVYELPGLDKTMRRFTVDVIERDRSGNALSLLFSFVGIDDTRAESLRLHRQMAEQKTQLEATNLSLKDAYERNELLHSIVKASIWSYDIDENDNVTAAHYDNHVNKNVSLETVNPMGWTELIHPDDKDRTVSEFMETVRDHSGNTPFEVTYRMILSNGGTAWIKTSGKRREREDGTAEVFGISINITEQMEEQQTRLLGAVPISPDILSKEHIGMWAFELDEGQPPRMYGDEAMLKLVGLDHQVPPEDMYHAWYDHIDKGSYGLVQDAVDRMMSGEHAEVQYPWHHPDGHTMIVRCGGVRNPDYTKGIRVEGTHQNVTEVLHFDDEERRALAETNTRLFALEDSFESLYDVNLKTGDYDEFIKGQTFSEKVSTHFVKHREFFEDSYINIDAVAYPDDREDFKRTISRENIVKELENSNHFDYYYRLLVDGEPVWFRMRVVYKDAEKKNIIIGIFNAEKERETQQLQEAFDRANEANESNRQVLSFVNGIKWTYTIDDSDQVIDVKYDDSAYGKFDINDPDDPLSWTKLIHPDDKEGVMEAFGKCLRDREGSELIDFAYRLLDRNGGYQWSKVTGRTFIREDGSRELTGITIDVTEQMEKEKERQQQLEEQLALSDGLAREYHTVWLVDGFGEHRLHLFRSTGKKTVQRAVQRGLDEPTYDSTMVKYVMDSVHEDDRERVLEASKFETVVRETPDVGTYVVSYKRYCDDEGNVDYHQMCFAKAVSEDGTVNYILAFRDADKMLKEQIAQQRQLAEALSMAESANRAKTTFLNNMSHDIRTPMNAIIGYTGLAASHIDNKEQVQDYLAKISQSSDHLLSLINDVLDMSRIESGKMNLDEKPENLSDIIHMLRDIVQADVASKQLDFFVDAVDVNDEDIICDKLRLNQVLLNVLSNAIKYTAAGGTVALRVAEKAVKQNGYASYEFCIKDNGMGMDEEFVKTIFDPFTRVKSSTVSGIQGTGLGMAITKNIVDMMGGSIDISSTPGKGTEVTINFDFKLETGPKEPEVIPELKGVRALVADDDSNTCLSICNMIEDIGMRSEWCTSGREAVIRAGAAHQKGDSFRVYIIDWMMPDMNGIETARRIRKLIGDDAPIIIITAYDWADIEEEAKEAGVTAFVSKPMFPSDLHRVLNRCIGKTETAAESDAAGFDFTGKNILLVEDNMLNREIATELLAEYGFTVDTAEDGDIAVEMMREAMPGCYDLVLMDIQMPRMDGYEATRLIRALPSDNSKIPIIAMTANAFEEDRKAALEAGMDEHIAKPIDIAKLRETMAKFL